MLSVTWITTTPVLIKVLGTLALVLVLSRATGRLGVPLACGTALLAAWTGHGLEAALGIAWHRTASLNNLLLLLIVAQVIWLSSQMAATGSMKDLVWAVRSRGSRRIAMALLPALIGLLPMPGGALFSAPLVGDCDDDGSVPALLKTRVNYWFRHVWEYWWPLYPGVLLAMELTGLPAWKFMLLQVPLTVFSIVSGGMFLLPGIQAGTPAGTPARTAGGREFVRLMAPVLTIIGGYALMELAVPAAGRLSHYLPMIPGIVAAMLLLQRQRPLIALEWRRILLSWRVVELAALVALVRVYGAFIEAPLPSGGALVAQMRTELDQWGIPVVVIIALLPFVSGLVSGLAIGFVGASFPIVMLLLGTAPTAGAVMATTVLAYGFGHMGMMLSPVHICLVVTNEHFATRLTHSLAGLAAPAACMLAAVLAYHWLLRWLLGAAA